MKKSLVFYLYSLLSSIIPSTRGFSLKRLLLRQSSAVIGKNTRLVSSARFFMTGKLEIGEETWVGHEVLVVGGDAEIKIGSHCDIAPRVLIASGTHQIDPVGLRVAGEGFSLPIKIGNGCWIGAGAVILGGTVLGENTIVAAGSVVKGSFPDRCIIGGVPAKIIKTL
jgi:acetyltransferase-like isoleucine patch superfamily enzyme